ncbi:cytochrome c oxidase subunit 6B1-like [Paramuricea clavata]|uniref:Cytochrome c oxidase subunit n=1 Tax=Paramuricea clavata TaxID=317549 RepID=A0A7D9DIH7_PARCT|nr:cytochrome c oxidase subunit 6B1-like [Paramuricea clavata]
MAEQMQFKVETAPFDARFPYTNQARNCWQNYCDYFRCIDRKGEDFEPCNWFRKNYLSLCPRKWVEDWDSQRDEGTFAGKLK